MRARTCVCVSLYICVYVCLCLCLCLCMCYYFSIRLFAPSRSHCYCIYIHKYIHPNYFLSSSSYHILYFSWNSTITGEVPASVKIMVPSARARQELLTKLKKMNVMDSNGAPENQYSMCQFKFLDSTDALSDGVDANYVLSLNDVDDDARELLGKGSFGKVFKGILVSTGEIVSSGSKALIWLFRLKCFNPSG